MEREINSFMWRVLNAYFNHEIYHISNMQKKKTKYFIKIALYV